MNIIEDEHRRQYAIQKFYDNKWVDESTIRITPAIARKFVHDLGDLNNKSYRLLNYADGTIVTCNGGSNE